VPNPLRHVASIEPIEPVNPIQEHLRLNLARADLALRHHPRVISGAVLALLLGSGFTAFGVAPLTTLDSTPVVTRIVTEQLAAQDLTDQLQLLDERALQLHRSDVTRANDTVDAVLRRLGIDDPEAAAFIRSNPLAQRMLTGRTGKLLRARSITGTGGGRLEELVVRGPATDTARASTHFNRLTVLRDVRGLHVSSIDLPLTVESQRGAGTISSSLFGAADDAGLPEAVTAQLADIFGSDVDFRRDLRKGDTFAVVYDVLTADGEPVTWQSPAGRVRSARFVNDGHIHEAVWFQDGDQRGGYYGPDGQSKARQFLASPLAFSRVTSGFSMRFHPILQQWRAHLGVDYGAPTGTPVRSVGAGTVDFAGVQNGYGNVVVVRHAGDRSTVYAHLSRIGVTRGASVAQGDTIGAVGSTGWATGPHLHFEFKVGSHQVDPVKVARGSEAVVLTAAVRPRFDAIAGSARDQLAAAQALSGAVARME
jgi:murein DD-endopeptidase MepM/ murein hydrolase activator NlpD